MAKARLKDIALRTGVSETTVSLVLSGKGNISAEVREKVIQTANELGYSKERSRKTGNRKLFRKVGILYFVEQEDPYRLHSIWKMVREIRSELKESQYVTIVLPVERGESCKEYLDMIMLGGVGAVFTVGFGDPELFHKLENMDIPVVVLNEHRFINKYFTICSDEFQGAYEGANYFLEKNLHDFLYISDKSAGARSDIIDRRIGVSKALAEYGIELNASNHLELFPDDEEVVSAVSKRLARADGICFGDPVTAMALLDAHPDTLDAKSIIVLGADDDAERWPLTKVPVMAVEYEQMGRTAAKVMMDRLQNKDNLTQSLKIKPHIRHI